MGRLVQQVVDGIKLAGFSLAGEETVVVAPEYNVCFDIGRAPRETISIDNVCLSHGHMDHAAGIAYYLSQRIFVGNTPGRVIVHRNLAQSIQKLMDVWGDIEGHPSPGQIIGVEHLEDTQLRRGLCVRAFDVNHSAHALGYTLIETRRKLLAEFIGKSGPELVALKKQGVQIQREVERPLITYTGDTALGRFLEHEFVRQSRVIITECTFFERDHRTRASAGRHIHVDHLPELLQAVPDAHIVLMHFSRRTDFRSAQKIVMRVLGEEAMQRVTFLMDRGRNGSRRFAERRDDLQEAPVQTH